MVQGGDFYNRIPTECKIVGTRRFGSDTDFGRVKEELQRLVASAEMPGGIMVETRVQKVADSYRIDSSEPIVQSLATAYHAATDRTLPTGATAICGNLPWFVRDAGIPAVYHGPDQASAHADVEYVSLDELVRVTRVYVALATDYLGERGDR
jgi:acetylornithine deacetylase/succinyl-diaminopimelate desuccinylase-like protein